MEIVTNYCSRVRVSWSMNSGVPPKMVYDGYMQNWGTHPQNFGPIMMGHNKLPNEYIDILKSFGMYDVNGFPVCSIGGDMPVYANDRPTGSVGSSPMTLYRMANVIASIHDIIPNKKIFSYLTDGTPVYEPEKPPAVAPKDSLLDGGTTHISRKPSSKTPLVIPHKVYQFMYNHLASVVSSQSGCVISTTQPLTECFECTSQRIFPKTPSKFCCKKINIIKKLILF